MKRTFIQNIPTSKEPKASPHGASSQEGTFSSEGEALEKEKGKESKMKAVSPGKGKKTKTDSQEEIWTLRLYVAGQTPKSITAFANLKKICDEHLAGKYRIEVIDLLKNPLLAKGDQIIAIPTLVRKLPEPLKKIIGDLANTERVLVGLDIRSVSG